jgi:hypothetical protein
MHILLTTYGLILIFILFATAQSRMTTDLAVLDIVARESFKNVRDDMLITITSKSKNYYRTLCPKEKKEKEEPKTKKPPQKGPQKQQVVEEETEDEDGEEVVITSLEVDQTELPECKRRTRFLHVEALFNAEDPTIHEGKSKACYTLLKNLLNALYEDQEFYEAAREHSPDIDELLLNNFIDKVKVLQEEEKHLPSIKVLCNLDLEDDLQAYVRSKMFTGTKFRKLKHSNEQRGYYPLHEFLSLQKYPKLMSVWLSPRPLLMALFQDEKVVDDLIAMRQEMYKELRSERIGLEDDKNKSQMEIKGNELKRQFSSYIHGIDVELIDFQVSSTKPFD